MYVYYIYTPVVAHRMRTLFSILILAIPFFMKGQETAEPILKVQSGNWWTYVGAYLTPELAFRTLKNNDGGQISEDVIESRNDRETMKFGYTSGLTIECIFRKNFGFETGISYSNHGYQTKKEELVFGDIIDPRRGFNYTLDGTASHAKFIDHFEYIGIPIAFKYLGGNWLETWRFSASVGCTTNYLIRASSTLVLYYEDDSPGRSNQTSETEFEKVQFNSIHRRRNRLPTESENATERNANVKIWSIRYNRHTNNWETI